MDQTSSIAALAVCNQAIAQLHDDYRLYLQRAEILQDLGRRQEALADWERAAQLNPLDAWLWNTVASMRYELGDFAGAVDGYSKSINLGSNKSEFYRNRAIAWAALQNAQAALADLNRTLELDPEDAAAYYLRGSLMRQVGELEPALADLNRSLALWPDNSFACEERGDTLLELGRDADAEADFELALELGPSVQRFVRSATTKFGQGQMAQALDYLERALAMDPGYAPALTQRARIHEIQGDSQAALEDYQMAVLSAPDDSELWLHCAELNAGSGAWQEAAQAASRTISLAPDRVAAYRVRATAHENLGQVTEARADLRKILTLEPYPDDRAWAEQALDSLNRRFPEKRGLFDRLRAR